MTKVEQKESKRRFRRSTLAVAVGLALTVSAAPTLAGGVAPPPSLPEPGSYFTPFADDQGIAPNPMDLVSGMLQSGGGVSVLGAQFQGNTGTSLSFGGYYEGGYFGGYFEGPGLNGGYYGGYIGWPDTVLGQFAGPVPPPGAPLQTDDDSSPLGDGYGDAFIAPQSGQLTLGISGNDDFDFNGLSDSSEDPAFPGSGTPHSEEGPYVLYLSVMDGVNDPDFASNSLVEAGSEGIDPYDLYDPATHADLAIAAYLGDDWTEEPGGLPAAATFLSSVSAGDVDTFGFDSGDTSVPGDGSFMLEPDALVIPTDPGDWVEFGLYGGYLPIWAGNPAIDPATGQPYDPVAADMVQNFLDLLDGGHDVAVVVDNNPLGFYSGYSGSTEFFGSASFVNDMNLGTGPEGENLNFGDGILLTSGVGTPPDMNTSGSFSGNASGQGDSGLDAILDVAFTEGLIESPAITTDATALSFEFTVPDGTNAVELDFGFFSEEYPSWNYPDLAAIFIDGRNYAIFPDGTPTIFDPDTPIADVLINNDLPAAPYPIEYDGISPVRRMVAPLADLGDGATHTFKAVVSDARDQIFDTGLFLANLAAVSVPAGLDPSDPILPSPDFDPTDGFDFRINLGDAGIGLDPTTPLWIDPDIAIGYTYEILSGPNFATLTLPAGYGDDLYTVTWWDPTADGGAGAYVVLDSGIASQNGQWLGDGTSYVDFLSLVNAGGVSAFQVLGIEVSAGLDPNDAQAFGTGLTWTSSGQVEMSMTPITTFVDPNPPGIPEPGMLFLMGSGMLAFGAVRRRQRRAA